MAKQRFNVTLPRSYQDRNGNEKTHFWHVGTAFPFETKDGKAGVSVKLYSRMLLTDEYVLFPVDEETSAAAPPDDDLPF